MSISDERWADMCSAESAKEVQSAIDFLNEAARYFGKRPTDGEDAAFWSNVANESNCKRIAVLIADYRAAISAASKVRAIREGDGEWVSRLERYEQFTDGWGDEVIGLKQHPKGDYVKFADVVAALAASPAATGEPKPLTLSPLHIDLLKRGSRGQFIWFHDRAELHTAEMCAVGDLCRAGLAKRSEPSGIPGPPEMPGFEITAEGRAALVATTGGEKE